MDISRVTSGSRPYQTMALPGSSLAERTRSVYEGPLIDTHQDTHMPSTIITALTSDREGSLRGTTAYACSEAGLQAEAILQKTSDSAETSRPTCIVIYKLIKISIIFCAVIHLVRVKFVQPPRLKLVNPPF